MTRPGWLVLAVALFAGAALYEARGAIADLWRLEEWRPVKAKAATAELAGVEVRIDTVRLADLRPAAGDRAASSLLLVRVALAGPSAAREDWIGCRVSLIGPGGVRWLPVHGPDLTEAASRLSPDGQRLRPCALAGFGANPDAELLSEQVFEVPSDRIATLRIRVSDPSTLPRAVEFSLPPGLRPQ